MEIQYHGANCVTLSGKKYNLVIDDNLDKIGLKTIVKNGDIVLYTMDHDDTKAEPKLIIDTPGEYEVSNISIKGIPARSHMDEEGKETAVIYRLFIEDIRIAIVGHVYPELNEDQLESIGTIDIAIIPVGGNGYTLDPIGAQKLIKKLDPKIVIPTHFDDRNINYEVPQQPLDEAVKVMGVESKEAVDKFKLKSSDIEDIVQLVVLNRN